MSDGPDPLGLGAAGAFINENVIQPVSNFFSGGAAGVPDAGAAAGGPSADALTGAAGGATVGAQDLLGGTAFAPGGAAGTIPGAVETLGPTPQFGGTFMGPSPAGAGGLGVGAFAPPSPEGMTFLPGSDASNVLPQVNATNLPGTGTSAATPQLGAGEYNPASLPTGTGSGAATPRLQDAVNKFAAPGGSLGSPVGPSGVASPSFPTPGVATIDQLARLPNGLPAIPGGPTAAPSPDFGSRAWDFASKNPGALIGAAGLGYQLLNQPQLPHQADLSGISSRLDAQGAALMNALNGQLPPGAKAAIDTASASAKAAVRSRFASMGLSGSTMELQEFNEIDARASAQVFDTAQKLFQQGVQASQLGANIYGELSRDLLSTDRDLSGAIANFSAAIAGGSPTLRLSAR